MAHNSSELFDYNPEQMGEIFTNKSTNFGATKKFPEGHLNDDDEGEIMFGIAEFEGKIILNFGKPVSWLRLTKKQAKQIAESLLEKSKT